MSGISYVKEFATIINYFMTLVVIFLNFKFYVSYVCYARYSI